MDKGDALAERINALLTISGEGLVEKNPMCEERCACGGWGDVYRTMRVYSVL